MNHLNRYVFLVLVLTLGVTFFTRNSLSGVTKICPEILEQPRQDKVDDLSVIRFRRNDYVYELTPVFAYDISALIVSRINYAAFTIYKSDKTFPVDLCLTWGDNAVRQVFKSPGVSFSQDCRWCWVQWDRDVGFNLSELSNNHLLISDPKLEKKVQNFHVGDQVRIKGKLVDVKAELVGKRGSYDSPEILWKTSTSRADGGAGACEVIYVEEAELLKKANNISCVLFDGSFYGLLLWVLWNFLCFVKDVAGIFRESRPESAQ